MLLACVLIQHLSNPLSWLHLLNEIASTEKPQTLLYGPLICVQHTTTHTEE